jgi:signal transduction histidine kinase
LPGTNFSKKGNLVSGFCKQDNPVESKDGEALPDDKEKRKLELLHRISVELIERQKDLDTKYQKLKASFLGNISHEMKTPLNGIMGMASILATTSLNFEQLKMVNNIKEASDSLLTIINNMLDFANLSSEEIKLNPQAIDFQEIIDEVKSYYQEIARNKGLTYNVLIDENLPQSVVIDKVRLNQVLSNLLSNAIKFTKTGEITLTISKGKDLDNKVELVFSIKDTGIGIKKEDISKIFGCFTQIDSSTRKQFPGIGLGLAISKKILKLMNSDLTVESTYGKGSTFSFSLVVEVAKQNPIQTPRILLVEDDAINQMVIQGFCENEGWDIQIASNGKEALNILAQKDKDLILMDIQMPEMNGYDVTKIIRQQKNYYIPIIATTAYLCSNEMDKCLLAGMNDFVSKPINLQVLKNKIQYWINKIFK